MDADAMVRDPHERLFRYRPGLSLLRRKKFRRGEIAVESSVDLHGLTEAEGRRELTRFLDRAVDGGQRCVMVVVGKGLRSPGKPVLRDMAAGMLSRRPEVLAFAPAATRDGGAGALYVLLRRSFRD